MDQSSPVTVVIRHRVRPGKEAAFEDWLRGITQAASHFDGYLGFNVVRPASPGQPEYVIFFRFDTFANLEKWEESETRREWLRRLGPLTVRPPTRERHTGLEVWFTPPSGHARARMKVPGDLAARRSRCRLVSEYQRAHAELMRHATAEIFWRLRIVVALDPDPVAPVRHRSDQGDIVVRHPRPGAAVMETVA